MKKMKIYQYDKCGSCKKAIKFLDSNKVSYEKISIVEKPPTKKEIKEMLKIKKAEGQGIKKLFNTSGKLYRELEISKKLPEMNENEAVDLLAKNGMLIKRPFLLLGGKGVVGFKQEEWESLI